MVEILYKNIQTAIKKADPQGMKKYINENLETLPKIAIREAITKIETGTKTKHKGSTCDRFSFPKPLL